MFIMSSATTASNGCSTSITGNSNSSNSSNSRNSCSYSCSISNSNSGNEGKDSKVKNDVNAPSQYHFRPIESNIVEEKEEDGEDSNLDHHSNDYNNPRRSSSWITHTPIPPKTTITASARTPTNSVSKINSNDVAGTTVPFTPIANASPTPTLASTIRSSPSSSNYGQRTITPLTYMSMNSTETATTPCTSSSIKSNKSFTFSPLPLFTKNDEEEVTEKTIVSTPSPTIPSKFAASFDLKRVGTKVNGSTPSTAAATTTSSMMIKPKVLFHTVFKTTATSTSTAATSPFSSEQFFDALSHSGNDDDDVDNENSKSIPTLTATAVADDGFFLSSVPTLTATAPSTKRLSSTITSSSFSIPMIENENNNSMDHQLRRHGRHGRIATNTTSTTSNNSSFTKKFRIAPKYTPLKPTTGDGTILPITTNKSSFVSCSSSSTTHTPNRRVGSSCGGSSSSSTFSNQNGAVSSNPVPYNTTSSAMNGISSGVNRGDDGIMSTSTTSYTNRRSTLSNDVSMICTPVPVDLPPHSPSTPIIPTNHGFNMSPRSISSSSPLSFPSPASSTTSKNSSSSTIIKKRNLIKTEFCKFILNGQKCKFGSLCNFAHSADELNYKTLMERHDVGLLDKRTLRTRPCFDFVGTGSCPFGNRCSSIHDPRIKTKTQGQNYWLPHCSLETKNLNTDLHIDWFRNYSFMETHYGHGLGQNFGLVGNASLSVETLDQHEDDNGFDYAYAFSSCGLGGCESKVDDGDELSITVMKSFGGFYNKVLEECCVSVPTAPKTGTTRTKIPFSIHITNSLEDVNQDFGYSVPLLQPRMSVSGPTSAGARASTAANTAQVSPSLSNPETTSSLTEAQRIEIALKMRTLRNDKDRKFGKGTKSTTATASYAFTSSTALYKYKPSHIIFNEMCMILQTRAFDIGGPATTTSVSVSSTKHIESGYGSDQNIEHNKTVYEIELDDYDAKNPNHFLVYDIAFGLAGSSDNGIESGHMTTNENNRMRALWFHVQQDDIHMCTLQERMNYKKTSRKLEKLKKIQDEKIALAFATNFTRGNDSPAVSLKKDCYNSHNRPNATTAVLKSFDIDEKIYQNGLIEKPIIMNLPMDRDLFDLTTEVLKHRLMTLTNGKVGELGGVATTKGEKGILKDRGYLRIQQKFVSLKTHFKDICFWPINDGREIVDENTLVPDVLSAYSVPTTSKSTMNSNVVGTKNDFHFYDKVWKSFITMADLDFEQSQSYDKSDSLPILKQLAMAKKVHMRKQTRISTSNQDILPHINDSTEKSLANNSSFLDMDSNCWNNLLRGEKDYGDWDMIKSFYASRN